MARYEGTLRLYRPALEPVIEPVRNATMREIYAALSNWVTLGSDKSHDVLHEELDEMGVGDVLEFEFDDAPMTIIVDVRRVR